MRVIFITLAFLTSLFAEYQSAKIDMHGGKNYTQYGNSQSTFGKKDMGFSALFDNNTSKKAKEVEVKK